MKSVAGLIATGWLMSVMLQAYPCGLDSIDHLTTESDLIFTAEITTSNWDADRREGSLLVKPIEFFKGPATTEPILAAVDGDPWLPGERAVEGRRVMLFAKATGDQGALQLLSFHHCPKDVPHPTFELEPARDPAVPLLVPFTESDTPLDRLIKELGTIFSSSRRSISAASLWYMDAGSAIESRRAVFRALADHLDRTNRYAGIRGLLLLGGQEGLFRLEEVIQADSAAEGRSHAFEALTSHYTSVDPAAVAVLERWLSSSHADQRQAAAASLARIHTAEAVRILAPLLHDPDFEVRYQVVSAMGAFANRAPIGGRFI